MYDIIVVGGGLMGACTAYQLVRHGMKVLLIDRADYGCASDASAGILSPETNVRDSSAWIDFALKAVRYYETFIPEIGINETGYAKCGLLKVATAEEESIFERAKSIIMERKRSLDLGDDLQEITPDQAREMFPPLVQVAGAIYHRNAARVDGRLLTRTVISAAQAQGLQVAHGNADRLLIDHRKVLGVKLADDSVAAPRVVIAGGAWSTSFEGDLRVTVPVQPQRGQIIHLIRNDAQTTEWPIVDGFRGHYMVPWPDHRVVAGATRETGSGFDARITVSGVLEVLSEAFRLAPGLATWSVKEMRVGLRPMSPDGLPILGAAPQFDGIYFVTGHGPTGLQLGPYSAKLVTDLILGRPLDADISPFNLSRFFKSTQTNS